ncbi:MAG: polyprenyl synthetase family protein [Verrucomicrobiota bacterium]
MQATTQGRVFKNSMELDRREIEDSLEKNLIALRRKLEKYPALEPYLDSLFQVVTSPGKRIRPLLFTGSYRAFSEDTGPLPDHIRQIAVALEIFHAFLLIHDDVIDQSSSRRGEPTLHKRIERFSDIRSRNAECSAIVLGDILQGYVFELLVDEFIESSIQRELIRYFARMIQLTGAGEALEIHLWDRPIPEVPESWIKSVYELKTAIYTFECPLVLGAMMAAADPSVIQTIQKASLSMGIAFQIENDLHEISLDLESFKEVAYDLKCGVKTLYLKRLYTSVSPADQEFLTAVLNGQLCALEHQEKLYHLLRSEKIRSVLKSEIDDLFQRAAQTFDSYVGSAKAHAALKDLLEFIVSNRKHSESALRSQTPTAEV